MDPTSEQLQRRDRHRKRLAARTHDVTDLIGPGSNEIAITVAPGWTESPMTRGHVDPDAVRRVSRTMALRKIAQPEDVARQVVVLASDELSGHVTGQVVTVAGGMEGRVIHD